MFNYSVVTLDLICAKIISILFPLSEEIKQQTNKNFILGKRSTIYYKSYLENGYTNLTLFQLNNPISFFFYYFHSDSEN